MRSILFSFRGIESDTRKRKKREIHESFLYRILLSIQIFSSLFFFNKKEKKSGEKLVRTSSLLVVQRRGVVKAYEEPPGRSTVKQSRLAATTSAKRPLGPTQFSFVTVPCNLMLRSELQLFLNADPEIRVIWLGVQLSTFILFHSFKAPKRGFRDEVSFRP
jgi:hypothetical protein